MSEKLLRCPFCPLEVKDGEFMHHVIVAHPLEQGRMKGSYVRWLDDLRVKAGGDWRLGVGQGDGMGQSHATCSPATCKVSKD